VRTLVAQARSFSICGRFDEAIVRCELALHLDPFSAVARAEREKILQCAKISEETKREPDRPAGEALMIHPTFPPQTVRPVPDAFGLK
jgi:hypothetical protein